MATFVAQTSGVTGFSTSIALTPPQAVTVGQVMYVAISGEDSAGAQFITGSPSGWTRILLYNGSRQFTVWRKVATAADAGTNTYTWTQNTGFPASWVFALYARATVGTIATGTALTPIGGTYEFFPAMPDRYAQVVAFTHSDSVNNDGSGLIQRARRTLNLTPGLNISAWDTGGAVNAGVQVGINTSGGGASAVGWVLESLAPIFVQEPPSTLPAVPAEAIGTLVFDSASLTFIPLDQMPQVWERAENAELDPTGLIRMTGDGLRLPRVAQVEGIVRGSYSSTYDWYDLLRANARLTVRLEIAAGGSTLTLNLLRGLGVEPIRWAANYLHFRLNLYPSAPNLT